MRSPRLASVILVLSVSPRVGATVGIWQPVGPDGGEVSVLAAHPDDPSVAYAASRAATIFRTDDGGAHWRYAGAIGHAVPGDPFSTGPELDAFAIDRTAPTTLYAAVGARIHRSLDGGATWIARGKTDDERPVRQLIAVSGVAPALLALVAPTGTGEPAAVQRSTDGGLDWSAVVLPPRGDPTFGDTPHALVMGSIDTRLWVVTGEDVLQSDDAGITWVHRLLPSSEILAFAPSWSSTSTFYFIGAAGHVFASTDAGNNWDDHGPWTAFDAFNSATILGFQVDAHDPSVLYMLDEQHIPRRDERRLLLSRDAGRSWNRVDDPTGRVLRATGILTLGTTSGSLLLSGETEALAISIDQGDHLATSQGLQATSIETLALSLRPPTSLFAGASPSTLFASVDDGPSWQHRDFFPPSFPTVRLTDLEVDPVDPAIAWAAVREIGLYKINRDLEVLEVIPPAGLLGANEMALAPSDRKRVYVAPHPDFPADDPCGFEKSTDAGATWTCERKAPLLGIARALAVDPIDPDRVYIADEGRRLLRTLDGAATFEVVDHDLDVTSIAVDPVRPLIVFAGTTDSGVWRSIDRGAHWQRLTAADLPPGPIGTVLPHPVDPDLLYVSIVGTGIFVSRDGGATFARLGFGLPADLVSGPLAVDPRLPSTIYAATRGAGLWRVIDEQAAANGCVEDEWTLCLSEGRFRAQARWRDFQGKTGAGRAVQLTGDTGYFWFFTPDNLELMVKALDARIVNDYHWVFYGALSNVEFELLVTDTLTGEVNSYFNPERSFASRGDTSAFPRPPSAAARRISTPDRSALYGASLARSDAPPAPSLVDAALTTSSQTTCLPDDTTLCVRDGRFRVRVEWKDFKGGTGSGHAQALNGTTGTFWFFDDSNLELAIKILDGRAVNGHFWVFYGALSNVEYRITVEDTTTSEVRTYFNPLHQFASRGDTAAFADP